LSTHLRLGLPSGLFSSGFPTNSFNPIRATCPAHHILLVIIYVAKSTSYEAPHYTVFSILRHVISVGSKYSPQHPVLKHPQSVFLPSCQKSGFTLIQNHRQNYTFVYFNLYALR
jgi:hypothetical protein